MTTTALVIAVAGMPPHHTSLRQWLANLTMLAPWLGERHMDGAYWSIVNEIVFYFWVAVLLAAGLFERRLLSVIAAWLAICAINEKVLHWDLLGTALVTDYGPLFASGVLLHRLWSGKRDPAAATLLVLAIVLAGTHAFTMVGEFRTYYGAAIDVRVLLALHAGLYVLFAGALWASRYIAPTPLVLALGGLTYPLYLLHQTVGYVALNRLAPLLGRWPALVLVVAGLAAAAWAVWRFVEPVGRPLVTSALSQAASRTSGLAVQSS